MKFIYLFSVLFLPVLFIPAFGADETQPVECVKIGDACQPNKRIIVYAVYDNAGDEKLGDKLHKLLVDHSNFKNPVVIDQPPKLSSSEEYAIVETSFEFKNDEKGKIDEITFDLGKDKYFTNALFIRVTVFDTWHNFGIDHLKPCEIIDVFEFGNSNVLNELIGLP